MCSSFSNFENNSINKVARESHEKKFYSCKESVRAGVLTEIRYRTYSARAGESVPA